MLVIAGTLPARVTILRKVVAGQNPAAAGYKVLSTAARAAFPEAGPVVVPTGWMAAAGAQMRSAAASCATLQAQAAAAPSPVWKVLMRPAMRDASAKPRLRRAAQDEPSAAISAVWWAAYSLMISIICLLDRGRAPAG